MHAPLLAEHGHAADEACHEAAGVPRDGAGRHRGQIGEGHRAGVLERVRERPEPRAEDEGHLRPRRAGPVEGRPELVREGVRRPREGRGHRNIPAIVAVIQEAKAPPIMARSAMRERSFLRPSAIAPMPPIWMPIDAKFAKPQRA